MGSSGGRKNVCEVACFGDFSAYSKMWTHGLNYCAFVLFKAGESMIHTDFMTERGW